MSKILVIDDERAIRRALREILEFEEFEVVALIFSKILMFTIFNSLLSELLIVTMATPGLRSEI